MNKKVFLDIDGVLNTQGDKFLIENTFEETKLDNLVKLIKVACYFENHKKEYKNFMKHN